MQHQLNAILKDDHYTTGIYKSEDKSKWKQSVICL
jgi:hypothetical protein